MPGVSGWDFARELRRRGYATPIILMTGNENIESWAHAIGADGILRKPFRRADLLRAIEPLRSRLDPGTAPPRQSTEAT